MATIPNSIQKFLNSNAIAVAGVSRNSQMPANAIFNRLREAGHTVYALNPSAETVEGDKAYHQIAELPEGVEALMVASPPGTALSLVKEAHARNIHKVWFHRSIGQGSYDAEAEKWAADHDMLVIPNGCPMMYVDPVDGAHKFLCNVLGWFGRVPKA